MIDCTSCPYFLIDYYNYPHCMRDSIPAREGTTPPCEEQEENDLLLLIDSFERV